MACLAGRLRHHDPVGISTGTILVHLARIEPDYAKPNLISEITSLTCSALSPAFRRRFPVIMAARTEWPDGWRFLRMPQAPPRPAG
jgi:hypothetical protein